MIQAGLKSILIFLSKSANDWNKPDDSIKCFEGNPGIMSNLKTLIKSF